MSDIKTDALGTPIKIGQTYGFASNKNGSNKVVIGKAIKFTSTGVTLEVIKRMRSIYSDNLRQTYSSNKTNVKSIMLFPVNLDNPSAAPNTRKDWMRRKAITVLELIKNLDHNDNAVKTMDELAGFVMELTNNLDEREN